MGHGRRDYCCHGMSELRENGAVRGLDKISARRRAQGAIRKRQEYAAFWRPSRPSHEACKLLHPVLAANTKMQSADENFCSFQSIGKN